MTPHNKPLIIIVDDDPLQRELLKDHLSKMSGYQILTFGTGEECIAAGKVRKPTLVFLDYYLDTQVKDAMDGLEVLKEMKALHPDVDVVMISSQDKIEVAVNSIKYGAFDYIVKGEGAFYRAEKVLFNVYRYNKLKGDADRYKKLTIGLAIGIVTMFIVAIALQQMGLIKANPGWL